jgi:hypothetical protein
VASFRHGRSASARALHLASARRYTFGMSSPALPFPVRRRRRLITVAATGALLAGSFAVLPGTVQAAVQARPASTSLSSHTVTLVTGDVVTVRTLADGQQIADVDRPDDAVGGVRLQEINGDLYVVPDEAVPLLGADKLDRRLFNVSDLIEMGYDDASSGSVPLIATFDQRLPL